MKCKHGWTLEHLEATLAEEQAVLEAYETSSHPFRAAGMDGQRSRISCLKAHISEVA